MTYENMEAGLLVGALIVLAVAIVLVAKAVATFANGVDRTEASWLKKIGKWGE